MSTTDPWVVEQIKKEKEQESESIFKHYYECEPYNVPYNMGIDYAKGKDSTSTNVYPSEFLKHTFMGNPVYQGLNGSFYSMYQDAKNNPYYGYTYSQAQMEQNNFQQKMNKLKLKMLQNSSNPMFEITPEELVKNIQEKIEEKPKRKLNRFQLLIIKEWDL